MRKRGLFLSVIAAANCAAAGTVTLAPGPFEMADRIGPMALEGEPHKYEDPRLGASYQYYGGGLSLTIYVFNAGFTEIPDGGDSIPTCQAFEAAKEDLTRAGYRNVVMHSEQLARLDGAADFPLMREALFEYVREGHPTLSYVWITGAANQFVKLRFSVDPKLREELLDARRAILDAVGEAIKPHLAPAAPDAKDDRKNVLSVVVDPGGNPDDQKLALAYLMTLVSVSMKSPEAIPACGGRLAPGYADELAAWQGMLRVAKPTDSSKLEQRLQEIAAADFLEEFVWTYRHQDFWGDDAPDGLTLSKFKSWRRKHLKKFEVPNFGYVEVKHPRPMAVEPAP